MSRKKASCYPEDCTNSKCENIKSYRNSTQDTGENNKITDLISHKHGKITEIKTEQLKKSRLLNKSTQEKSAVTSEKFKKNLEEQKELTLLKYFINELPENVKPDGILVNPKASELLRPNGGNNHCITSPNLRNILSKKNTEENVTAAQSPCLLNKYRKEPEDKEEELLSVVTISESQDLLFNNNIYEETLQSRISFGNLIRVKINWKELWEFFKTSCFRVFFGPSLDETAILSFNTSNYILRYFGYV